MAAQPSTPTESPIRLTILGVTGTIGQNALDVVSQHPGRFEMVAITANQNARALADAARQTGAGFAAIADAASYKELKELTSGMDIDIAAGPDAVIEAAARSSDVVVAGIVGAAGLQPTLRAVQRGARVALANKECLVCAGELFMQAVREHGAILLPVDSEHNAIFQILCPSAGSTPAYQDIESITLTASGGPFREYSLAQMAHVTPQQAVKHPNWHMGAKISVDSATMVNKGLELIEAQHLFALPPEQLNVLVHPQSVVHGLVSYRDGSVLAQLSLPDMRIPLAYAMGWPQRLTSGVAPLRLAQVGNLQFSEPDFSRFPALQLAMEAMRRGGSAPTVLNAANEVAVQAFLEGRIAFLDIARVIENTLTEVNLLPISSVESCLALDETARNTANHLLPNRAA